MLLEDRWLLDAIGPDWYRRVAGLRHRDPTLATRPPGSDTGRRLCVGPPDSEQQSDTARPGRTADHQRQSEHGSSILCSRDACHLPIQKLEKIAPIRSSALNSPVISNNACCARRRSSANSSPARPFHNARCPSARWIAARSSAAKCRRRAVNSPSVPPVSYTHLTLPTI